ncbi:hypothetical protein FB45DRAFT_887512 [Roridomyces roridus]|uniref:Uncharacterized protein n=1 Tax=Roridomyces roridus TaxID=1738132 RepID=A0AAD7CJ25_9AGAR|nr:hypothetical protein FB45DRAFT_887512 [Roridomyces roridus]
MSVHNEELSDYEWLEHSDNDSLDSRDSDRDGPPSLPPSSRRSSISLGSSVDGEIDAWEGLVEDEPQDAAADFGLGTTVDVDEQTSDGEGHASSEEQLVTAALEQSLVGTLSASRTSSLGHSTVHNSLRDLRLSFPDPLTSSRDELNRSYETVSSPDEHCITVDGPNSPMTTAGSGDIDPVSQSEDQVPFTDEVKPEASSEPDALAISCVQHCDDHQINGFDVVLYPSTAESRDFAQWLLSVLATGQAEPASSPNFTLLAGKTSFNVPSAQSSRPSLAIVNLRYAPRLAKHTLYLPVVFPTTAVDSKIHLELAAKNWDRFHSLTRTVRVNAHSECSVHLDGPEMRKQVDPDYVQRQFQPLLTARVLSPKKATLGPVHAVTFVALFSLLVGFAVNTTFRTPSLSPTNVALHPTETTPSSFWNMFSPVQNSSVVPISVTPAGTKAIMPSTLKDFALAVFNPPITTPPVPVASISVTPAPSSGSFPSDDPKPMAWSDKIKSSTDVIVRPPTSLSNPGPASAPPTHTPSVSGTVITIPVDDSAVTSLSLKLSDSLAQVTEAAMKALEEIVAQDFRELKNALDALMRAISYQTGMIVKESKSPVAASPRTGQGQSARAEADGRATRAQSLKKSLLSTSLWRTYAEAHGEWSGRLAAKKAKRRDATREGRRGLLTRLKEKREKRKRTST